MHDTEAELTAHVEHLLVLAEDRALDAAYFLSLGIGDDFGEQLDGRAGDRCGSRSLIAAK